MPVRRRSTSAPDLRHPRLGDLGDEGQLVPHKENAEYYFDLLVLRHTEIELKKSMKKYAVFLTVRMRKRRTFCRFTATNWKLSRMSW